nr:unnamed protein product [Callosobruchus chinensis]
MSSLQAISNKFSRNPLVQEILHQVQQKNSQIKYIWTPAHVGIRGNEIADIAAKETSEEEHLSVPVTPEDLKKCLKTKVLHQWQQEWNRSTEKLRVVKPSVTTWTLPPDLSRRGTMRNSSSPYRAYFPDTQLSPS